MEKLYTAISRKNNYFKSSNSFNEENSIRNNQKNELSHKHKFCKEFQTLLPFKFKFLGPNFLTPKNLQSPSS